MSQFKPISCIEIGVNSTLYTLIEHAIIQICLYVVDIHTQKYKKSENGGNIFLISMTIYVNLNLFTCPDFRWFHFNLF